jgi:hypothetical protein
MKKVIYCIIILQLSGSCLSVSRQQQKVVQQFATKTENFAVIPQKIMGELADIREMRGIYYANSLTDPVLHLDELNAIVKERLKDDRIPELVWTSFRILDEYAGALVQLSSNDPVQSAHDSYLKFGVELETLVGKYNNINGVGRLPSGIGTTLARAMDLGTKHYLANRQYKELKKFVNLADTLVAVVCGEMVRFLSSEKLGQLIQAEETGITESFRFYFTKRLPTVESEKEYVALKKHIELVKIMQGQAIQATKNLRIVHGKLAAELNRKFTFEEIAVELNNFYKDVDALDKSIKAIGKQ